MSYGNLLTMSSLQTALDAFIASIPLLTTCRACPCESRGAGSGRNPAGSYRCANRLSSRFVSLVFLMRSIPGAPPTGTLRVSKSVPDGFVPPAGTCSLRPSPCLQPAEPAPAKAGGQALGATLRASVAVQIVCPDNLSLNQTTVMLSVPVSSTGQAPAPAGGTNLPGADLDVRRTPCAPWKAHIKNPARSSHQLVRNAG